MAHEENNSEQNTQQSIKKKLNILEDYKEKSAAWLGRLEDRLTSMEKEQGPENQATQANKELHDSILLEFKEVQDEMQEKFASQVAENKRLQTHLVQQKNEMMEMQRLMSALEERVRSLELDVGTNEDK